ncbi:hypothetical protein HGRIS_003451 [Hohenbuehelia grisea]|uniref:Gamma-glutamylcyclotransferase AIG2-like domain-containing protein n=1 Tax=Hohenbuehelia grisea TaxID=104357 RepID=A0ABR3JGF8_9AGAR
MAGYCNQYADYPGILPYETSKTFFGFTLDDQETRSVRGSMVTGLTERDLELLDIFEGNEYTRQKVHVHPLGELESVPEVSPSSESSAVPSAPPPLPTELQLQPAIEVETYVYNEPSSLARELWSYEDFVQKNAWKWIGGRKETEEEYYSEVDTRNAANAGFVARAD